MCGRYYVSEEMKSELEKIVADLDKKINGISFQGDVVPSANALILASGPRDQVAAKACRWGYQTNFSKRLLINARAETVNEKKLFASSLETARCVIPAAGFYEWDAAKNKFSFMDKSKPVLYMAGLYRKEEDMEHFVIITTAANSSMEKIHNRMPLILDEKQMKDWLYHRMAAESLIRMIPPELKSSIDNEQIGLEFY